MPPSRGTRRRAADGNDIICVGGSGAGGFPGALIRGGSFSEGAYAGVFAADGLVVPSSAYVSVGFRCAREL
jgi:hypothetical protein